MPIPLIFGAVAIGGAVLGTGLAVTAIAKNTAQASAAAGEAVGQAAVDGSMVIDKAGEGARDFAIGAAVLTASVIALDRSGVVNLKKLRPK